MRKGAADRATHPPEPANGIVLGGEEGKRMKTHPVSCSTSFTPGHPEMKTGEKEFYIGIRSSVLGLGCSSVLECLAIMCESLGSIRRIEKKERKV